MAPIHMNPSAGKSATAGRVYVLIECIVRTSHVLSEGINFWSNVEGVFWWWCPAEEWFA
jgi:hypothetical protein